MYELVGTYEEALNYDSFVLVYYLDDIADMEKSYSGL